jgi:hypothetical protein
LLLLLLLLLLLEVAQGGLLQWSHSMLQCMPVHNLLLRTAQL